MVPAGLLLGVAGLLWLSRLNVDTTYMGTILPGQLVMAIGMGFIFMSVTNVALVGISKDDAGVASAMVNTTQQVGGSLGTALLTTFSAGAAATFLAENLPPAGSSRRDPGVGSGRRPGARLGSRLHLGRRCSSPSPRWRRCS